MGSSDYSGDSDSGGSSYSFGGKKREKKDKKDKKEKKDKDKGKDKKDHKDKDGKDKDKKDKKDKDKDEKEHKDKDKKDKDKKDKKDKDKHHDDKPSTSYAAPSYPAAGSSGHGTGHGVPSFPSLPSAAGGYHNPALGISHPSPLPPPSGPPPTAIPKTMSFDAPPSGYRVPLDSNDPSKSFPSHSFETSGPPVSYDLDGSPIFIGSVLFENSVHPCKIGPHLNPPAQVAYGGGENGHHGRYDLLPFVPDQMEWVPTGYGQIPHGRTPVEGGYEEGGEKLYHALAVINDVKVPGKTGEHL
jgi:hypothetical protein